MGENTSDYLKFLQVKCPGTVVRLSSGFPPKVSSRLRFHWSRVSPSRLIQVIGRLEFLAAVAMRSPFSFWLLDRGSLLPPRGCLQVLDKRPSHHMAACFWKANRRGLLWSPKSLMQCSGSDRPITFVYSPT